MHDLNQQISKEILDNLYDGIYLVDTNRVITYWNKGAERISGFTADELIGTRCSENTLIHVDQNGNVLCLRLCPLMLTMQDEKPREAELFLHHKEGHRVPILARVNPVYDEDGRVCGGCAMFTDLSSREANLLRTESLKETNQLDELTQLSNHEYLEQQIISRLSEFETTGLNFGLLMIDIDNFTEFNNTYDNETGDEVLKFVSRTFTNNSRPFDIFGHLGGGKFAGIIRNVSTMALTRYASKISAMVKHSFLMQNSQRISVTISIGGTITRPDDTLESLFARANNLLQQSKDNGQSELTIE